MSFPKIGTIWTHCLGSEQASCFYDLRVFLHPLSFVEKQGYFIVHQAFFVSLQKCASVLPDETFKLTSVGNSG